LLLLRLFLLFTRQFEQSSTPPGSLAVAEGKRKEEGRRPPAHHKEGAHRVNGTMCVVSCGRSSKKNKNIEYCGGQRPVQFLKQKRNFLG
jgi:hypothetical protein